MSGIGNSRDRAGEWTAHFSSIPTGNGARREQDARRAQKRFANRVRCCKCAELMRSRCTSHTESGADCRNPNARRSSNRARRRSGRWRWPPVADLPPRRRRGGFPDTGSPPRFMWARHGTGLVSRALQAAAWRQSSFACETGRGMAPVPSRVRYRPWQGARLVSGAIRSAMRKPATGTRHGAGISAPTPATAQKTGRPPSGDRPAGHSRVSGRGLRPRRTPPACPPPTTRWSAPVARSRRRWPPRSE